MKRQLVVLRFYDGVGVYLFNDDHLGGVMIGIVPPRVHTGIRGSRLVEPSGFAALLPGGGWHSETDCGGHDLFVYDFEG